MKFGREHLGPNFRALLMYIDARVDERIAMNAGHDSTRQRERADEAFQQMCAEFGVTPEIKS